MDGRIATEMKLVVDFAKHPKIISCYLSTSQTGIRFLTHVLCADARVSQISLSGLSSL
jgi:hypothetical protein